MKSLLHNRKSPDAARVLPKHACDHSPDHVHLPEHATAPPPARRYTKNVVDPLARYMGTLKPLVATELEEMIAATIKPQLDQQARLIEQLLRDVESLKAIADTQRAVSSEYTCGAASFVDETTEDGQLLEDRHLDDPASPDDVAVDDHADPALDADSALEDPADPADPDPSLEDITDDEHFADASGDTEEPFILTSGGHRIATLSDVDADILDQCRLDDMYKICELFSLDVPAKAKKTKLRSIILHAL